VANRLRPGRRAFLLSLSALAVGCDTSRPRTGALGTAEHINLWVQRGLFSPGHLAPTARLEDTTPGGAFPSYFVSPSVPLAPPAWLLRVRGLIDRPLDLSLDDLRRMRRTDIRVRHYCVEGWSAVASWHGVQVAELARAVGASPEAKFVEFRSFDSGYYSSWDRESAEHAQSILAYGMNGEPLSPAHGAPLRLYGAVKLGYKSVKYLDEIRFLSTASGGYWEDLGYEWYAGV
jgi:DMSO/TMAO reductase YedYZ molybdopterin-dependent catalytic subunit